MKIKLIRLSAIIFISLICSCDYGQKIKNKIKKIYRSETNENVQKEENKISYSYNSYVTFPMECSVTFFDTYFSKKELKQISEFKWADTAYVTSDKAFEVNGFQIIQVNNLKNPKLYALRTRIYQPSASGIYFMEEPLHHQRTITTEWIEFKPFKFGIFVCDFINHEPTQKMEKEIRIKDSLSGCDQAEDCVWKFYDTYLFKIESKEDSILKFIEMK